MDSPIELSLVLGHDFHSNLGEEMLDMPEMAYHMSYQSLHGMEVTRSLSM